MHKLYKSFILYINLFVFASVSVESHAALQSVVE